eukprot:gnl/TRDRNA2_/TRDRNA2_49125_c0_seq1.p1 gnl/TRDRNA2_/TRDRNA2_49125_c0~~gnl/TRDRNA2_/TRDRNA2_49125_c0_seq1.p1  ORF type:complete len:336 (+),score=53.50 gnl/TRDRNA2_/TRDRNA2_49125_c0_seq1:63-1070(+)
MAMFTQPQRQPVSASMYYANYHGHTIEHLERVHMGLRQLGCGCFVWFTGDSTLDNKHWLYELGRERDKVSKTAMHNPAFTADAVNGYESILSPPRMVQDVCYWLNRGLLECKAKGTTWTCAINTAVEESTLRVREEGDLLAQDQFIRDHIGAEDILVVSLGGNDVALAPTAATAANMAALLFCSPTFMIRWCSFAFAPRSCGGSFYFGFPFGLAYFVDMFKNRTQAFIERLIEKQRPKKVVVCMLYYLDEQPGGSWADSVLHYLGYDTNPKKLQALISRVFDLGTSKIAIPGVEVVPLPLFEALDGTDHSDYCQRVEPSVTGGEKMGRALVEAVL